MKLAKVAAMAYLAALDQRTGRNPSRTPQLLDFIIDWIDSESDLSMVVQPELEKLGKQMGFEVKSIYQHPGNEEEH